MKKIILGLTLAGLLVVPIVGLAQDYELGDTDVEATLEHITNWLFGILIMVAIICFIIAALYFITSAGDEGKVKTAKNFVLYAIIGLVVAFLARGFVALVSGLIR